MKRKFINDTITALGSARGKAGLAIVRVSGPEALSIGWKLFRPRHAEAQPTPRKMILGEMFDLDGQVLDEVLFVYFPESASYTAEPVVEFHLHGGPVLVAAALETLTQAGARPAEPGEFTRRAFLGGRIDLAQAEAVADLIAARSLAAARAAHRRLTGALSDKVVHLRQLLAEALALLEAQIDFPDDDLGRIEPAEITQRLDDAATGVEALLAGHARAKALAEGAVVVLAGRPNAGKSSLLNRLAGARRALVHERAGTTRDLIEAEVVISGVPLRLIDTAGLQSSADEVERQGVAWAKETIADADLIVYLVDGAVGVTPADLENLAVVSIERRIIVWNKADLVAPEAAFRELSDLAVSATLGQGLEELSRRIVQALGADAAGAEALLATVRHRHLAERAKNHIAAAKPIVLAGNRAELAALELRDAANALGEIIGETTVEQVLDVIFSRFCIGK